MYVCNRFSFLAPAYLYVYALDLTISINLPRLSMNLIDVKIREE